MKFHNFAHANNFIIMKKLLLLLFSVLLLSSCEKEDGLAGATVSSYRDGVFSKNQTEVYINSTLCSSVTSVAVKSVQSSSGAMDSEDENIIMNANPKYMTEITLDGFPEAGQKTTLNTESDLTSFSGSVNILGVDYSYEGVYTGDPLQKHEDQGIIIHFTTR